MWDDVIGARLMDVSGLRDPEIDRADHGLQRRRRRLARADDGPGLGLLIAAPWLATSIMFSKRDKSLI